MTRPASTCRWTCQTDWPAICFVGRLDRQKGLPFLLRALARLRRKRVPLRNAFVVDAGTLDVVGDISNNSLESAGSLLFLKDSQGA